MPKVCDMPIAHERDRNQRHGNKTSATRNAGEQELESARILRITPIRKTHGPGKGKLTAPFCDNVRRLGKTKHCRYIKRNVHITATTVFILKMQLFSRK